MGDILQMATRTQTGLAPLREIRVAITRAAADGKSPQALLAAFFDALARQDAFPIHFVAEADDTGTQLRLIHSRNVDPARLPQLGALLADPDAAFGDCLARCPAGLVIVNDLPAAAGPASWDAHLRLRGVTGRAILPLMHAGRVAALAVLYSTRDVDGPGIDLLNDIAAHMSIALALAMAGQRRRQAERESHLAERRFRDFFENLPLPMHIASATTGLVTGHNKALRHWLGQAPGEVPARELVLWGRDGRTPLCAGAVATVGDEVFVAWREPAAIRPIAYNLSRDANRRSGGFVRQLEGALRWMLQAIAKFAAARGRARVRPTA